MGIFLVATCFGGSFNLAHEVDIRPTHIHSALSFRGTLNVHNHDSFLDITQDKIHMPIVCLIQSLLAIAMRESSPCVRAKFL